MQLKEFTVWIEIEGTKAKEYGFEMSKNKDGVDVAACWIPSEHGKKFAIHCSYEDLAITFNSRAYVDGTDCGKQSRIAGRPVTPIVFHLLRTSETTKKPFIFTHLDLTDDDQYLDQSVSETFGRIELRLNKAYLDRRQNLPSREYSLPEKKLFHERSKKVFLHRIGQYSLKASVVKRAQTQDSFGDDISAEPSRRFQITRRSDPIAHFQFKYRTLDQLMANGIAPRDTLMSANTSGGSKRKRASSTSASTVEPISGPGDNDNAIELSDDEPDPAEIQRLQERLAKLQEKTARNEAKRVKREPEVKREIIRGDFIDLTL
ncbi:hypothetical protein C8J56DRAFT_1161692 [Mycena floridula]|nr:hypothetical protein C8J56DRAFT_1161692 [Mycena floridula]